MTNTELDHWLAVNLMGWELQLIGEIEYWIEPGKETASVAFSKEDWTPTTRIDQALGYGGPETVVGKMRERWYNFNLNMQAQSEICVVTFHKIEDNEFKGEWKNDKLPSTAICKAAKVALEHGQESKA